MKNAATYMTGSVLAQALMLAAIPMLSRLYGPEDFGVFGLFSALLSIAGVASCLRYELAIPLPGTRRQAAQVFATGTVALLCVSLAVLIMVILGHRQIAAWMDAPRLESLLWLLPVSVLGYGLYELLNYWTTRRGKFKALAVSHVLRAAGVTGTQMGAAAMPGGAAGLVLGQLTGQWVANFVLAWQALRQDRAVIASGFRVQRIREQARRYRSFARYGAPQAVLNSASQAVPAIMLGWFFSPAIVGLYIMAQRVVSAPLTLIAQSLRQAMLPHFARQHQAGLSLRPLLWKYTAGLALLGLPAVIVLLLFGEELFSFVLGREWAISGRYAAWLVIWLWAGMINPPAVVVLTVLQKQRLQFAYEAALLLSRIAALASAAWTKSAETTIIVFSIVGFAFNAGLILLASSACRHIKAHPKS